MLTRRAALQAILAAPAFRLVPFEPRDLIFDKAKAYRVTLSANTTLTLTPTGDITLRLIQDHGGDIVKWPSGFKWKGTP